QVLERALKEPFEVGLIAHVDAGALECVVVEWCVFHFDGVQTLSALAQPVVLSHLFDQDLFSKGGGLMFFQESLLEIIEIFRALPFEQSEDVTSEAMTECVLTGCFFSRGTRRTGGVLGIFAIRRDLRLGGHFSK